MRRIFAIGNMRLRLAMFSSLLVAAALGQEELQLQPAKVSPILQAVTDRDIPAKADSTTTALVDADAPIKKEIKSDALEEKHEAVTSQLRLALMQEQANKAAESGEVQPAASASAVDLLKQIEVLVAQQEAASANLEDLESREKELKLQLGTLAENRMTEDPPYSIMLVDQLRDSIKSLTIKAESLQASITAARDAVEQAHNLVEEKQRESRQLKKKTPDADFAVTDLEVRLAEEMLLLRRQELAIEEAGERIRMLQLAIDEKKVEIIGARVTFTKEMLDQKIDELYFRESELKRKAASLQSELQFAERDWLAARQKADTTPGPSPELLQRVDALKSTQQAIQQELSVTNQHLQRLPMIRTAWERRFLVIAGMASRHDRRSWLEETIQQIDQLRRERRSRELKINEVRGTTIALNAKLDAMPAEKAELRHWLEINQAALTRQSEILTSSTLGIDTATKTLERLRIQIEGEKGRTFSEWVADAWSYFGRIWNYELTHAEDVSITIGEVVSSVLLLFLGFFAAKWISGLLARRLPKFGVDEAGVSVIESLSFYALLIAFGLTALKYANVPLTVFTFLGGAIAIGVGFGSQNILNNFISGLILLAERPIKVGDLIQLGETYGNVTKIGARSTQIRTGENLDIIVPNSKFLENDVTNLTRRDDRLRTSISVGVAYGSPLDKVVTLLEQAATESEDVQEHPKPMVWFNDFGDNSLVFQVHFWIKARTMTQMKRTETDVRLNIDRLFREHEIVIAFPQRDLHIQTPRPIELRLTGGDADDPSLGAAG